VIPVVDLRLRFGIDSIEYNERTCIIVVEIEGQSGTVMIGTVVDSVSAVLNIKGEDIEDTPPFGTKLNTDYILLRNLIWNRAWRCLFLLYAPGPDLI